LHREVQAPGYPRFGMLTKLQASTRILVHLSPRRCYSRLVTSRHAMKLALLLAAALASGRQAGAQASPAAQFSHAPVLVVPDIGSGIMPIDGAWQFHLGDDPTWAQPSLDDS